MVQPFIPVADASPSQPIQEGIDQLANAAFQAYLNGDVTTADMQARQLLTLSPGHPVAVYILALVFSEHGDLEKADELITKVVEAGAVLPRLHFNYGVIRLRLNDFETAEPAFARAVEEDPGFIGAWSNLGVTRKKLGKYSEAMDALQQALAIEPENPGCLNNLGSLLLDMADLKGAEETFRRVLSLAPNHIDALDNLGRIMETPERRAEAVPYLETLVSLVPQEVLLNARLGAAYAAADRKQDADAAFEEARKMAQGNPGLLNKLGLYLRSLGNFIDAMRVLDDAVKTDPTDSVASNSLGAMFHENGRLDLALPLYKTALEHDPENVHAYNNLGNFYKGLGYAEEGFENYRKAVELFPTFPAAWRNLLAASLYHEPLTEKERFQLRKDFVKACAPERNRGRIKYDVEPSPEKKLRVGIISSDFRDHPIARNLGPFLFNHDRDNFELYCYGAARRADRITEEIRNSVEHFQYFDHLSDAQLAAIIAEDKIDILLSIAGYFDENRPLVSVFKPAPVIISYHDGSSSAIEQMDYIISDRHLTPPYGEELFSEQVLRIPSFYMHEPLDLAPEVGPSPFKKTGYVTFGSTNNPAKLGDDVLDAWGELLAAVPTSKLLLKYRFAFKEPMLRDRILSIMAKHGVGANRVDFWDKRLDLASHLSVYGHIDIALDPYPFGGSTTTFESLWMGAPVITKAGTNMMARMPTSILKTVGLDDFIATDRAEYLQKLKDLANDPARLQELRQNLRDQVRRSPICDVSSKNRYLQRLLRAVWRRWCNKQTAS